MIKIKADLIESKFILLLYCTCKVAMERGNELQTDTRKRYSHAQRKVRKDKVQNIAKECVVRFCHSEIPSRIDMNQLGTI